MELIVHIGMPKTATTTLQKIYFPLVAKENQHIEYHGVFQPRGSNKTELYRVINKYINTGINLVQSRELLKTYQQKNKVIHIVSEEMIVVSEENTSWRTKTSRLIELLNGINYTLLVSVREPLLGSFSYYVERYLYFKNKKISYKQAVNSEESIDIYKYEVFFSHLLNLVDKEKIRLIKFDDIVNNKLDSLNELLRINKNQLPELPVLNAKKSTRNHIVKVENKSFSTLVESVLPRYIYMKLKFVVSRLPFLKRYAKKLMSNNIRQSHRVKKMSEADKKHFKVRFEKGVKYIQIEFGLNFD